MSDTTQSPHYKAGFAAYQPGGKLNYLKYGLDAAKNVDYQQGWHAAREQEAQKRPRQVSSMTVVIAPGGAAPREEAPVAAPSTPIAVNGPSPGVTTPSGLEAPTA